MQMFNRKLQSSRAFVAVLLCAALFSTTAAWQGNATAPAKAKAAPTLTAAERKASARDQTRNDSRSHY